MEFQHPTEIKSSTRYSNTSSKKQCQSRSPNHLNYSYDNSLNYPSSPRVHFSQESTESYVRHTLDSINYQCDQNSEQQLTNSHMPPKLKRLVKYHNQSPTKGIQNNHESNHLISQQQQNQQNVTHDKFISDYDLKRVNKVEGNVIQKAEDMKLANEDIDFCQNSNDVGIGESLFSRPVMASENYDEEPYIEIKMMSNNCKTGDNAQNRIASDSIKDKSFEGSPGKESLISTEKELYNETTSPIKPERQSTSTQKNLDEKTAYMDVLLEKIFEIPYDIIKDKIQTKIIEQSFDESSQNESNNNDTSCSQKSGGYDRSEDRNIKKELLIEHIIEYPIENIVENYVYKDNIIEKHVDKIVEVPVEVIKRVPVYVERLIDKAVYVDKIIHKEVEKIVENRIPVEKIIEVPVEKVIFEVIENPVENLIYRNVEKVKNVEIEKIIEKKVYVDNIIERKVEIDKIVEKEVDNVIERKVYTDKIVERGTTVYSIVEKPVEKIVEKLVEVKVDKIVEVEKIIIVEISKKVEKITEVDMEIEVIKEVQIEKVIESEEDVDDELSKKVDEAVQELKVIQQKNEKLSFEFDSLKKKLEEKVDWRAKCDEVLQRIVGLGVQIKTSKSENSEKTAQDKQKVEQVQQQVQFAENLHQKIETNQCEELSCNVVINQKEKNDRLLKHKLTFELMHTLNNNLQGRIESHKSRIDKQYFLAKTNNPSITQTNYDASTDMNQIRRLNVLKSRLDTDLYSLKKKIGGTCEYYKNYYTGGTTKTTDINPNDINKDNDPKNTNSIKNITKNPFDKIQATDDMNFSKTANDFCKRKKKVLDGIESDKATAKKNQDAYQKKIKIKEDLKPACASNSNLLINTSGSFKSFKKSDGPSTPVLSHEIVINRDDITSPKIKSTEFKTPENPTGLKSRNMDGNWIKQIQYSSTNALSDNYDGTTRKFERTPKSNVNKAYPSPENHKFSDRTPKSNVNKAYPSPENQKFSDRTPPKSNVNKAYPSPENHKSYYSTPKSNVNKAYLGLEIHKPYERYNYQQRSVDCRNRKYSRYDSKKDIFRKSYLKDKTRSNIMIDSYTKPYVRNKVGYITAESKVLPQFSIVFFNKNIEERFGFNQTKRQQNIINRCEQYKSLL